MNWIHKFFTTPEAVISFINTSNIIFIILIIGVGIYTYLKYYKVIEEIDEYDYVITRFNKIGAETKNNNERKKWEVVKEKIKNVDYDKRPASILSKLNEVFSEKIALELKKANSWFEGLSSLGLFGTVFGLLLGTLYTTADNSGLKVMVSSFSTALITTFFGLLAQLLIRITTEDVKAENKAEEMQGKFLQIEKLAFQDPNILSNNFLDKENSELGNSKTEQNKKIEKDSSNSINGSTSDK